MVINVGALRSGDHEAVKPDIQAVVKVLARGRRHRQSDSGNRAARRQPEDRGLHALQSWRARISSRHPPASATAGATAHDIALMRAAVGPNMGVKASGGIRTLQDLQAMAAAGATRIGASASVKIVEATAA